MFEQKWLLNILLDNFGLCLWVLHKCHEFLNTVINAIYSKSSGIVAWLNNPNISCSISGVLRNLSLHLLVEFKYFADGKEGRSLPPMVPIDVHLAILLSRVWVAHNFLECSHFPLAWHKLLRKLGHICDWEFNFGVTQYLRPSFLIVHLRETPTIVLVVARKAILRLELIFNKVIHTWVRVLILYDLLAKFHSSLQLLGIYQNVGWAWQFLDHSPV